MHGSGAGLTRRVVDLGRFGRFEARWLLEKQPGGYYKIEQDGSIQEISPSTVHAEQHAVDQITANNQTLTDTNTSQRLTTGDIEQLKQQVVEGRLEAQDVVDTVVRNSETFGQKNAFSQIKYVQRKQKKFLRWFCAKNTSLRTLTRYFTTRDPRRILYNSPKPRRAILTLRDLRLDSLSQIICLANIQPAHGKYLVWEDTLGFLSGAILSKTDETSVIVNVHPDRQLQVPALMYYNFDEATRARLLGARLADLDQPLDLTFTDPKEGSDPHRSAIQRERFLQRAERRGRLKGWFDAGCFDSLIIVTAKHDPLLIISRLSAVLKPSARVVLYSTWRDLLLPCYMSLRKDTAWVDVSLSESWLRPYQTMPGRVHPLMSCNGHTGAILSATKVSKTTGPAATPKA